MNRRGNNVVAGATLSTSTPVSPIESTFLDVFLGSQCPRDSQIKRKKTKTNSVKLIGFCSPVYTVGLHSVMITGFGFGSPIRRAQNLENGWR